MSAITKNEHGFLRANKHGRVSREEIDDLLNPDDDEEVYRATTERGARTAKPADSSEEKVKPGDTFTVGPRITKASEALPDKLRREAEALRRAGFGGVEKPKKKKWGWVVRLKGMTLPGGVRTDALLLLPDAYPMASPIGFYIREGAAKGKLDRSHLFDGAYEGAKDLSEEGWQWFCGVVEGWKPGRHTLVTYLSIVMCLFDDQVE